jgi:hypothetical protein
VRNESGEKVRAVVESRPRPSAFLGDGNGGSEKVLSVTGPERRGQWEPSIQAASSTGWTQGS